jgi:hypothetical protein
MPNFIALSGVPSPTLGANGDNYYNTINGVVYEKTAGFWVVKFTALSANFFRAGSGIPDNALGINGDYYINRINGNLYEKVGGVWILRYSKGGSTGYYSGTGVPSFAAGNGDHYLDTVTGFIYKSDGNTWTLVYSPGSGGAVVSTVSASTYSYALAGKWLVGWEVKSTATQIVKIGTSAGGDDIGIAEIPAGTVWVGNGSSVQTITTQTVYFSGLVGTNTIKIWVLG